MLSGKCLQLVDLLNIVFGTIFIYKWHSYYSIYPSRTCRPSSKVIISIVILKLYKNVEHAITLAERNAFLEVVFTLLWTSNAVGFLAVFLFILSSWLAEDTFLGWRRVGDRSFLGFTSCVPSSESFISFNSPYMDTL